MATSATPHSTLVSGHRMRLITQAKYNVASVRDELQAADESGSANVDVPAAVRKLDAAWKILDDIDGRRKQHLDPHLAPKKKVSRKSARAEKKAKSAKQAPAK